MDFIAFHFLATKLANIYDTVIYKAKKNEVKFREIIFCQTHNLEVLGSSPSWSTLKHKELRKPRNSFFHVCVNNAETFCFNLPFSVTQYH